MRPFLLKIYNPQSNSHALAIYQQSCLPFNLNSISIGLIFFCLTKHKTSDIHIVFDLTSQLINETDGTDKQFSFLCFYATFPFPFFRHVFRTFYFHRPFSYLPHEYTQGIPRFYQINNNTSV